MFLSILCYYFQIIGDVQIYANIVMEISLILFLFLFIEIHSLVDKELPPPGNLASPLLPCFMLPHDFIQCDPPTFYDNASTTDPTIGLPKVCKDNESNKYGRHRDVQFLIRFLK